MRKLEMGKLEVGKNMGKRRGERERERERAVGFIGGRCHSPSPSRPMLSRIRKECLIRSCVKLEVEVDIDIDIDVNWTRLTS
jgi:hypothetical protein